MKNENSIIITDRNLSKTEEQSILESSMMDLTDFMDNFQYLVFVLDGSGSMYANLPDGSMSKIDLEKKVILRYTKEKIGDKASGMKVGIVEFSDCSRIHLRGSSSLAEIQSGVNLLGHLGGSTYASKGIRGGITMVKKSKNMIPRLVLASDGALSDMTSSLEAAEQARDAGIVIDTIFIGSGGTYDHECAENLKRISAITGGVHEEITGEHDFEVKFLKVADRPLLSSKN